MPLPRTASLPDVKRRKSQFRPDSSPGFQIAPMIDVVFVIMLYFMVMAGSVRKEVAHTTQLPGPPTPEMETPDEISIRVAGDGQVTLNDDPLDTADSTTLPELAAQLRQIKATDVSRSGLLVTIDASESVPYQRVVDVLDALSQADIHNVTFQTGASE